MHFRDKHADFGAPSFVARIQATDEAVLRDVVPAYLDQVLRAARAAGLTREPAEVVTQSTLVTFVASAGRFEGRSHVRTRLFGILYRKVAEERRQIQKEMRTADIQEVMEQRFRTNGYWLRPPREAELQLEGAEIGELIE